MNASRIEAYSTSKGVRIYRIPLQLFPGLDGYSTLIVHDSTQILLDTGSGFGDSNEQLEQGLVGIQEGWGERVGWDTLTAVLISHGHIDHYGGLHFLREKTSAPIGIHRYDLGVLTDYEDRLLQTERRLRTYLVEAGVPVDKREELMELYLLHKQLFSSIRVDFTLNGPSKIADFIEVHHVPGHCPGQIVLKVDDYLLCSDHILPDITPHQAPERLSLNAGLSHYLDSLQETLPLARATTVALGGHKEPFDKIEARIFEIIASHEARFGEIFQILNTPSTVYEVSVELFDDLRGYHKLLAIEEAGAHVEYLFTIGAISIANTKEVNRDPTTPYRYLAKEDAQVQSLPMICGLTA